MPLIETDTIYALLNSNDKYHKFSEEIIKKIISNKLEAIFSSASLVELALIYKSKNIENEFKNDLIEIQRIKNIEWAPLDAINSLTAAYLRETYQISFFDSLHAGIALNLDNQIISQDKGYDLITGLKRIPLTHFKHE